MAKKVCVVIASIALTVAIAAILGINILNSIAIIVMAVLFTVIIYKAVEDFTDGNKITPLMWGVYGCSLLGTILFGFGMSLSSIPLLIGMGVAFIGAIVCYMIDKKMVSNK